MVDVDQCKICVLEPMQGGQAVAIDARFMLEARHLQLKMELSDDTVVVTLGSCPQQSGSQSHGCLKK